MFDKSPPLVASSSVESKKTFSVFHSISRTSSMKKVALRTSSEKSISSNRNISIEGNKETEPPRGLSRTSQIKRINNNKTVDKKIVETVEDPYELPWDEFLRYQLTLDSNKAYLRGPEAIINSRGGRVSALKSVDQPPLDSSGEPQKPKKSESLTQSIRMKGTATAEKIARTLTMKKLRKENRMTVLLSPTGSPRASTLEFQESSGTEKFPSSSLPSLPSGFERIGVSRTITLGSLGFHRQRQKIIPTAENNAFHQSVVSALDNINTETSDTSTNEICTPGESDDISRSSSTDDSSFIVK